LDDCFLILITKFYSIVFKDLDELRIFNNVDIFSISILSKLFNECLPVFDSISETSQDLDTLFFEHLDMNGAIVRAAHRSLPAFILLTGGSFRDSRIILSEIKEFLWINFHSYSILEVLI
jgi:hypothetical protein